MPVIQNKQQATMVSSPQKQKKKKKSKKQASLATSSMPYMSNGGVRNSFMTDNSAGGLLAMLDQSSAGQRHEIYSKVNSVGVTSAGIEGQSGNLYLDCLVDPSRGPVRYPDDFDKPTAVHQQVNYYAIASGASGGANPGAFNILLNPFIGLGTTASFRDGTLSTQIWGGASWTPATYVDADQATLASICNNIRPVSASLYVTYIGDTLNDGGQISAALIPGNGITTGYLSPTGQDLRLVANLALQPEAYSGPLRKGVYCFWQPEDPEDTFFKTVNGAAAYSYPVLVVSGVSTQFSTTVVRVTAVINYEYTTSSKLVTSLPSPIEPALITGAKKILQSQPNCIANDDHSTWWTRVLNGARDLFTTIGNGVYQLFHPSLRLVQQAAADPNIRSAVNDYATYRGVMSALAPPPVAS